MRQLPAILSLVLGLLPVAAAAGAADPFLGSFVTAAGEGKKVEIVVERGERDDAYKGEIRLNDKPFPFTAHRDANDANQLSGAFESGGKSYGFTAGFADGRVKLSTGNSTFALAPVAGNPLDGPDVPAKPAGGVGKPADLPAGSMVLRQQVLADPILNMDAYSVLVPEKWKMGGELRWAPRMPSPYFDLGVADPVKKLAWRQFERLLFVDMREVLASRIRQFPQKRAFWEQRFAEGNFTELGPEIRNQPASPREYIEKLLIPRYVPEVAAARDVAVVSETDLPDLARAHTEKDPFHRDARATRLRMTYTTPDGPVEREFICTMTVQKTVGGQVGPTSWIPEVTTYRAPRGKLDAALPTLFTIEVSLAPKLPWFNAMMQVGQMFLQRQREANDAAVSIQGDEIERHARVMRELAKQSSDIVSEHIRTNFATQQAGKAAVQKEVMHYINDTMAYTNPNDGSIYTLPANYKYQYVNNRGDVFQTDSARIDPPVDPQTSWTKMERAAPGQ